jgi:AraC-like DNA-binding protein
MLRRSSDSTGKAVWCTIPGPLRVENRLPELALTIIGHLKSSGHYRHQQVPELHGLHFVEKGRGVMRANGKDHSVGAGELFVFFPGTHYIYHDFPESPWRYHWINLEGSAVDRALAHVGITADSPRLQLTHTGAFEGFFSELMVEMKRSEVRPTYAVMAAWRLMDLIAKQQAWERKEISLAERARYLIDRQGFRNIRVEELARELGVERSTLFRAFREAFQVGPKEYIDAVRLNDAERMLSDPGSSVKQIADACGFGNLQYFIRAFRKKHGVPPGYWRTARKRAAKQTRSIP